MRLFFKPFGNVAAHDALRQAFDDRRLADAGIADQHRIVLGAAREHLNDAADLFVAPDDRIELAALGFEREVATVALERFVGAFGILASSRADCRARRAAPASSLSFVRPASRKSVPTSPDDCAIASKHVFDRRVVVLQRLGLVLGDAHDARQLGRERHLRAVGAPRRSGAAADRSLRRLGARSPSGSAPAFARMSGAMPRSCSSSAASMCSGVVCVLCSCKRARVRSVERRRRRAPSSSLRSSSNHDTAGPPY